MISTIKKLVDLANKLDSLGYKKAADLADKLIQKYAASGLWLSDFPPDELTESEYETPAGLDIEKFDELSGAFNLDWSPVEWSGDKWSTRSAPKKLECDECKNIFTSTSKVPECPNCGEDEFLYEVYEDIIDEEDEDDWLGESELFLSDHDTSETQAKDEGEDDITDRALEERKGHPAWSDIYGFVAPEVLPLFGFDPEGVGQPMPRPKYTPEEIKMKKRMSELAREIKPLRDELHLFYEQEMRGDVSDYARQRAKKIEKRLHPLSVEHSNLKNILERDIYKLRHPSYPQIGISYYPYTEREGELPAGVPRRRSKEPHLWDPKEKEYEYRYTEPDIIKRRSELLLLFKIAKGFRKLALTPYLEQLKQELMQDPMPLRKLMEVYRKAQQQTQDDLFELFGDRDRAEDFEAQYPGYVPEEVEAELNAEFGQKNVDRYLYGIGTDDDFLTVDDVQELLLQLLDSHRRLKRRRDKNQIKERFGIYSY